MNMSVIQPKAGRGRKICFNSSLLDIGRNMDTLITDEAVFYADQQGERKHLLSQDIDMEYEKAKEIARQDNQLEDESFQSELAFIDEETYDILIPSKCRKSSFSEKNYFDKPSVSSQYRTQYCS